MLLTLCVFATTPFGSAGGQQAPKTNNRLRDRVDSAVHDATLALLAKVAIGSMSIGMFSRTDGRTYDYGEIALGSGRLATSRTLYAIGSITKTFTATLLATAVVDGRLRLDDDVRRHLPGEYPNLAFAGQPIRLTHLITHLSGLPRNLPESPQVGRAYTRTDFANDLRRVVLDTFPGARLSYSNAAAQLLSFILEDEYRTSFERLLTTRIARPLKMAQTKIALTSAERTQMARGYDSSGVVDVSRFESLQGAGAVMSTVDDLMSYLRWHAAERDSAVRLTHRPVLTMGNYHEALNWQMMSVGGVRTIWQDGGLPGYTSLCAFSPELGIGVVILTSGSAYASGLSVLASALLGILDERAVALP